MVRTTLTKRNRDVTEYLAQTSISDEQSNTNQASTTSSKSPQQTAQLAQQLASEGSWADNVLGSSTSMTSDQIAAHAEQPASTSEYATPDDAPPTYELATSESNAARTPSVSETPSSSVAPTSPFSQPQPHRLLPEFSQPRPHELMAPVESDAHGQGRSPPPFVPGRHYERHETSSSINGTFTLHDSLDLSTTSGSINIRLDVRPGSGPAILKLKAKSGSIHVVDQQHDLARSQRAQRKDEQCQRGPNAPSPLSMLFGWAKRAIEEPPEQAPTAVSDDPRKQPGQHLVQAPEPQSPPEEAGPLAPAARAIHATIETQSGSVNATLIITPGAETRITTGSGSQNLRFVTTGNGPRQLSKLEQEDSRLAAQTDLISLLSTNSSSGSQNISISTGFSDTSNGAIVSACRAKHYVTGSASLHVNYPREWFGLVHASSGGSGSISVRGFGLEHDKRGNKEEYAWRGTDLPDIEKAIELRCDGSGSIGFSC